MWSCDRRAFLAVSLAAAGCGFQPVHGPGGAGAALSGRVALAPPESPFEYAFARRLENRLGRPGVTAPLTLSYTLQVNQRGLGGTSAGVITRYRVNGSAQVVLRDTVAETVLLQFTTTGFTGYSATGSTVATLAAERDAENRLMVLLADQVVDGLLLRADDLPA